MDYHIYFGVVWFSNFETSLDNVSIALENSLMQYCTILDPRLINCCWGNVNSRLIKSSFMAESDLQVVVGLGITGLSCVDFLKRQGSDVAVTDTRLNPPYLTILQTNYPDVMVKLGCLDLELLEKASRIILSPGIALHTPVIANQVKRGIPVLGDIELFARAVNVPVIGITGTNAKSTVTSLVAKMAQAAGYIVQVGGNLGVPALDLLIKNPSTNLFVLELSSFQLETTHSLYTDVSTILNITPDHMDRYRDITEYQQAKQRIYQHCHTAVSNRDDPLTLSNDVSSERKFFFTLNVPKKNEFGLLQKNNTTYLAFESLPLLAVNELPIMGKHHQANALAALAVGYSFGLPFDPMLHVLREFKGLPHRCQFVREDKGVRWYNDSKGTNVGATLAAIDGLGSEINGKLILIAGGVGKNADFSLLIPAIKKYIRHVVLIGEAATELAALIGNNVPVSFASSMFEAVQLSAAAALPNDSVLLSPACASFDMFNNFEHRGEVFMEMVNKL